MGVVGDGPGSGRHRDGHTIALSIGGAAAGTGALLLLTSDVGQCFYDL